MVGNFQTIKINTNNTICRVGLRDGGKQYIIKESFLFYLEIVKIE